MVMREPYIERRAAGSWPSAGRFGTVGAMRTRFALSLAAFVIVPPAIAACSAEQVAQALGADPKSADPADAGSSDAAADATVQGAGCGVEQNTGLVLCRATAQCPNVVIDSEAFPDCGFRIRGSAVDLVCACGQSLCSMGAYVTCAQAAQLLVSQTEQAVCQQVAEDRCSPIGEPSSSSSSGSGSSSSSSSSSSGGPGCDHGCLSDCGGGAACASVCGCG
jgi:hypothetical protein